MKIQKEKGMTLLEVLVTIIILTIVSLFIFSIMSSSSKQQQEQTKEVQQIQDGAYILKQITKDLRKSYKLSIDTNNSGTFYFTDQNSSPLFTYKYDSAKKELYRNNTLIGTKISNFTISGAKQVYLSFDLNNKNYNTTIVFRRGTE